MGKCGVRRLAYSFTVKKTDRLSDSGDFYFVCPLMFSDQWHHPLAYYLFTFARLRTTMNANTLPL